MKWLYLVGGGVAGTVCRYLLAGFVYEIAGTGFPYGTLIVNLAGCFVVGFLSVLADQKFLLGPEMKMLLMIGFCGAFTTFSTLILETANLLGDGEVFRASMNMILSVALGFAVFFLGVVLAKLI